MPTSPNYPLWPSAPPTGSRQPPTGLSNRTGSPGLISEGDHIRMLGLSVSNMAQPVDGYPSPPWEASPTSRAARKSSVNALGLEVRRRTGAPAGPTSPAGAGRGLDQLAEGVGRFAPDAEQLEAFHQARFACDGPGQVAEISTG